MIHLDTNVLIVLPELSAARHPLTQRLRHGEAAAVSALVWFEFLCGPLSTEQVRLSRAVIGGRIIAPDDAIAERGALLFNAGGRRRSSRTDCLIAATAIAADAELFSYNARDFQPFVPYGLKLAALTL